MSVWTKCEPVLFGIPGELAVPSGDYKEHGEISQCVAHYTVEVNGWRVFAWNSICLVSVPASEVRVSPGDTIEWRTEFVRLARENVVWMPDDDPIARLACIYDACNPER